jgi:ribosomal protein S18 acetylase RimI-like enzyme
MNEPIMTRKDIEIKLVETEAELQGIRDLQEVNLPKNLSVEEASREGFVTASYTLDFLRVMHRAHPSVIAKEGEAVVGYALVATQAVRQHHDLLNGLFNEIDAIIYRGRPIKERNYVVVGQLCVGKGYRAMGLAKSMYDHFRACLSDQFDSCLTDVVQSNVRSLRAHEKTGFQVVGTLEYGGVGWDVVMWDWKDRESRIEDPRSTADL